MPKFCPNCGSEIDASWKICQKCGNVLESDVSAPAMQPQQIPQGYPPQGAPAYGAPAYGTQPQYPPAYGTQPQYPQYQQYTPRTYGTGGTPKGTISLICGILGLVCCSLYAGIILGPIAIYYGNRGIKEDANKGAAQAGLILGILDIVVCFIGFYITMLFLSSSYYYY